MDTTGKKPEVERAIGQEVHLEIKSLKHLEDRQDLVTRSKSVTAVRALRRLQSAQ